MIVLIVNGNNIYFDSFGVEHIPKETKKFIGNKNIITNIYRIQAYDSIICGYFCIAFIDFILNGKSSLDYANVFFPNKYEKNDKTTLKYLNKNLRWKNYIALFVVSIENLNILKYHTFPKKHYFFLLSAVSAKMMMKKYLKENNKGKYWNSLFN